MRMSTVMEGSSAARTQSVRGGRRSVVSRITGSVRVVVSMIWTNGLVRRKGVMPFSNT